tara:strand:+ start:3664 stop:4263 length:600 start_codon:yes stop_codon:yes gene_type:complete
MTQSIFDTISAQAFRAGIKTRTPESEEWFTQKVKELQTPSRKALLNDTALQKTTKVMPGDMYMYFYDPKHKETLPYYDRFPLTIMVGPAPGGFYGLNLHYLNPVARARLVNELFKLAPKDINDTTRLKRMRYDLLTGVQKYREFKPCFKHYLLPQVKSQFARVPMTDWETAIYLPVQQFKKKGSRTVWAQSTREYRQKK